MTDGLPAASDATELKLRGLERLRTAGMVGEAEYSRMRAKLLADAPAAPLPPPPAPAPRRGSPRTPEYTTPAAAMPPSAPAPAAAAPPSAPAPVPAPPPSPAAAAPAAPPSPPAPAAAPTPVAPAPTSPSPATVAPMPAPAFVLSPSAPAADSRPQAVDEAIPVAPAAVATAPARVSTTWSIRTDASSTVGAPAAPAAPPLAPRAVWAPTTVEPPSAPPAAPPPPDAPAPWPPATPAAPRSRGGNGWVAAVAIVGILAAASIAYLAFGRGRGAGPGSASASAGSQSGPGSASGSSTAAGARAYATLDDFVPDAKAFVEQHRGLAWQQPVTVVGLDDAAFEAKLVDSQPVSPTGAEGDDVMVREFKALHLVPQGFDPKSLGGSASASGVEGFYDFKTKELYVRGTKPTPYTREVVVHELTHALQDQWYGLGKLFQKNDIGGESVEAFLAVVEGDATRIERQYRDSLSSAEQQQAAAAANGTPQQQQVMSTIPKVFLTLGSFPYGAGIQFDQAVMDARGQSALDAAFRSPPTTTAEVLDPKRYLDDVQAVDVPLPNPAGTVFDAGSLGGLGFTLVFGSLPGMTQAQAVLAAGAWGGDTYVAYTTGGRSCVRDSVVATSVGAQRSLDSSLQRWVASSPAIRVTSGALDGSGPVTVTACTG